ncbi:V-type ATPase subunit [Flavonifractor plautii]|nr:V-type ATPase subunit [Flavonifractor plautii]
MKNAEMTYGALSAKIRALYGKRLRADDFARLAGLKNEAELLEALRQHPGWSRALSLVPPAPGPTWAGWRWRALCGTSCGWSTGACPITFPGRTSP